MGLYSESEWEAVVARRDAERLEWLRRAASRRAAAREATALPPLIPPRDADTRPEREVRRAHGRGTKKH